MGFYPTPGRMHIIKKTNVNNGGSCGKRQELYVTSGMYNGAAILEVRMGGSPK